ncbi:hypothetical protein IMSAG185_01353 [Lachnospiraceae bacterium]|nr:hypothetical protein IMSAG185_01353 [Lachnospiraceae bacterium]
MEHCPCRRIHKAIDKAVQSFLKDFIHTANVSQVIRLLHGNLRPLVGHKSRISAPPASHRNSRGIRRVRIHIEVYLVISADVSEQCVAHADSRVSRLYRNLQKPCIAGLHQFVAAVIFPVRHEQCLCRVCGNRRKLSCIHVQRLHALRDRISIPGLHCNHLISQISKGIALYPLPIDGKAARFQSGRCSHRRQRHQLAPLVAVLICGAAAERHVICNRLRFLHLCIQGSHIENIPFFAAHKAIDKPVRPGGKDGFPAEIPRSHSPGRHNLRQRHLGPRTRRKMGISAPPAPGLHV